MPGDVRKTTRKQSDLRCTALHWSCDSPVQQVFLQKEGKISPLVAVCFCLSEIHWQIKANQSSALTGFVLQTLLDVLDTVVLQRAAVAPPSSGDQSSRATSLTLSPSVHQGDLGGTRTLQKKWTTFQKARLECSLPERHVSFNNLRAVFTLPGPDWRGTAFFGIFHAQW